MKNILILILIISCTSVYSQSYRNLNVRNKLSVDKEFILKDNVIVSIATGDTLTTNEFLRTFLLGYATLDSLSYYLTETQTRQAISDSLGNATGVSFGTSSQMPYTNSGGTDFDYGGVNYDGTDLKVATILDTTYIKGNRIDIGDSKTILSTNRGFTPQLGNFHTLQIATSEDGSSYAVVNFTSSDGAGGNKISLDLLNGGNAHDLTFDSDGASMSNYNPTNWTDDNLLTKGYADTAYLKSNLKVDSSLTLKSINETDHSEGRMYYDNSSKSLVFQNDIAGFNHNLGYENVRRVYNITGVTIPNGTAVRKVGVHLNGDVIAAVDFAGIGSKDSAQVYGVVTTDILAGGIGIATRLGDVRHLNLSVLNDTAAFLGFKGIIIDTCPKPPYWCTEIGEILYNDNDSGVVDVNIQRARYAPSPVFSAKFEDAGENIENNGVGIYSLITNTTNDLFESSNNVGFEIQGDSIRPLQDGNYSVLFSFSFGGTAAQTDEYRIGIFVNGAKEFSILRTASGNNSGGVPFPFSGFLTSSDWITFKVANLTIGTRDCTFSDGAVTITYSE